MRLTAKELEQMKSVDIGAVAPESLPDVSGMAFDTSLPREERIALFLQAVENPYCFCIGGIGVVLFARSSKEKVTAHPPPGSPDYARGRRCLSVERRISPFINRDIFSSFPSGKNEKIKKFFSYAQGHA